MAVLFLSQLCSFAYSEEEKINLLHNGDFERRGPRDENLWDGVNSLGQLKVPGGYSAPVVVDLNGDGKKDLVVGTGNGRILIYENIGTNESPQFTTGKFIQACFDWRIIPQAVDWNGNGKIDIIFGSRQGWVYWLENTGSREEWEFIKSSGEPGGEFVKIKREKLDIGQFSAPAVFDWNEDGKKDLLLGEGTFSANSIHLYLNSGSRRNPKFREGDRQYLAYGKGRMHLRPSVVDWDQDGDPDLVVGDEKGYFNLYLQVREKERALGQEKVAVLEYAGRLKVKNRDLNVVSYATPDVVDWDEDGDGDIVSGSSTGLIYLILNQGSAEEPEFSEPVALRGTDVHQDVSLPYAWTQAKCWWLRGTGNYLVSLDEEAHSGKYSLKITCLDDSPGITHIIGRLKSPLENEVEYELTFYVKGEDAGDCGWTIWWFETGTERGERYRGGRSQGGNFRVTSRWRQVRAKFKLSETEAKRVGFSFRFNIKGEGTIRIDQVKLARK